jgi:hypothetical protein
MRRASAVALVLGLVAAGCGGSRPEPSARRVPMEPLPAAPAAAAPAAAPAPTSGAAAAVVPHAAPTLPAPAKRPKAFAAVAAGNAAALGAVAATVSPSAPSASAGAGTPTAAAGEGAQFGAAADAVCASYRQEVRGTGAHATTLAAQESELQDLVGETAAALGQVSALSPPPGDGALVARFVALTRSSVGDFVRAQNRSAGATGEAATVALEDQDLSLARTSARDALAAQATARRLGLHVCGSPGAEWL